jgi:hypothetical protein
VQTINRPEKTRKPAAPVKAVESMEDKLAALRDKFKR